MSARPSLRFSINALRAFEAVARTGGVTPAAAELGVTPSAIGFHLRALQAALGVELLRRTGRGVSLSHEGKLLAKDLAGGFSALEAALDASLARRASEAIVEISTLSFFAARWLIPQLAAFRRAHPDIEVRATTTDRLVDLEREGFDLAVRSGLGQWPGLEAAMLFPQRLTPLCTASYAAARGLPHRPADLRTHVLIGNANRSAEWAAWFEAAGVDLPPPREAHVFDSRETVLEAVRAGMGFGIADRSVLAAEIANGELLAPFPIQVPSDWGSYVCWSPRRETRAARTLRAWLLEAARTQPAAPAHGAGAQAPERPRP